MVVVQTIRQMWIIFRDNREHMTFCKLSEDGDVDPEGRGHPYKKDGGARENFEKNP